MDWDRLLNEATRYLQEYIRIQTVNPPGNEIEGATFLQRIFERDSIPCEIFEPSPGRGSILATLKGRGEKKPLLLLSHIDVVPAERDRWEVDPFEGVIKDGYLYGRGALDDKSMGIIEMMALLILKREGISLNRDILFFAAADEETGGRYGVQWGMQNIPALRESEFALNEGGEIVIKEDGVADRYEVSNGQKVIYQLQLKVEGTSGHASMPTPDNPNVKLLRALEGITKWETPFKVLPTVKEYFSRIAARQAPEDRALYEDIENGLNNYPAFAKRVTSNPISNAMVRDTIALTVLQGGSKANVIPSEASAILDCRLIPGTSKEEFLEEIRKRLKDEVQINILSESRSILPSSLDTDLFEAIQKFASKNDPGCPVVPLLLPGATDSRFLREMGMIVYDFCPFRLTEKELLRAHGNNERIALSNLLFAMRAMVEIIKEVAA